MNFDLTKEQEALRQRVRDFAEQEVKPVARKNDENQHFDVELTLKMAELGLLGMTVPKEYGGQGLDNLSYIIAVEELARVDGSTAATIAADNSLGYILLESVDAEAVYLVLLRDTEVLP